jgi:hypothetical protein
MGGHLLSSYTSNLPRKAPLEFEPGRLGVFSRSQSNEPGQATRIWEAVSWMVLLTADQDVPLSIQKLGWHAQEMTELKPRPIDGLLSCRPA